MNSEAVVIEIDRDAPALSPFLPGTNVQFAWDSTSLSYLKTCPRLYQYLMIEGWGTQEESIHLRFGIEYHQALQDYDIAKAQGVGHEEAIRESVRALLERTWGWEVDGDTKAGKYKNRKSILRTVIDYLDYFKDDPAQTLILPDGRPAVELSFRFELDWGPGNDPDDQPYILSGHLDRVVNYLDHLYVMDRKTTTITPGAYYFNQFEPNNQMSLYTLASKIILDSPVKGVIIDAAQILVDSSRFVRGITYRTPDQLEEWTNDLHYWLALAQHYATQDYWPMNDLACDKYGGCRFREICSKSPKIREKFLEAEFTRLPIEERWNPLKPR